MNGYVEVKEKESLDSALDRLKRKLKDGNVWKEYHENQEYTPPSKERRNARHAAKVRNAEKMAEIQRYKSEQHKLD